MLNISYKALEPFTSNSWNWSNKNVIKLEKELTEEDRTVFGFDIRHLDWKEYLETYAQVIGIKVYFLVVLLLFPYRVSESSCSKKTRPLSYPLKDTSSSSTG